MFFFFWHYFLNRGIHILHILPRLSVLLVPIFSRVRWPGLVLGANAVCFWRNVICYQSFWYGTFKYITTLCVHTFSSSFMYSCPPTRFFMTCTCVVRNRPWNERFMKMSGTTLQGPVVTVGTVKFKIKNSALCPHSILMCFCEFDTVWTVHHLTVCI